MNEAVIYPIVGAVVVAIIAGAISLSVTILTKDQKVSEFRQLWIDALRSDVSKLVGILQMLIGVSEVVKRRGKEQAYDFLISVKGELIDVNNLITSIRLRLNVNEHVVLLKLLSEVGIHNPLGKEESEAQIEKLVVEAQKILKDEWRVVKRGEWSFRILKFASACIFLSGLAVPLWYYYPFK
ncbi:hypothetical protein [Pseudomonas sp. BC115LW]|uniref:hypothetical protein n=1 Tax=Pseudomonas sp. BC115LW TaxID=2683267 RepID=UPI001413474B|nr:hypothetical protein [Pseudomonas sp. BC115LW]NBB33148.1 hypothetical protein [Pseudomonas sp. BC115LW]